jgi:uncharacterized protein YceK
MRTLCLSLLIAAALLGGCSGEYVITAPDQVADANGTAATVVRLQRQEFWFYAESVEGALLRLRIGEAGQRGAYTDELGYAATSVLAPAEPGVYALSVDLQDDVGVEASRRARAYVWPADQRIYAVDYDALPPAASDEARQAAEALGRLAAGGAALCYMTRRGVDEHHRVHEELASRGCPDGPVLLWQREYSHLVYDEWWKLPRLVVETRLVSELETLRERFANVAGGITSRPLAAKAFEQAGLPCLMVGSARAPDVGELRRVEGWTQLGR